ncbi:hypothetical protein [Nocardia sp. CY41]|uniref:hypothetical protein n=1 Tax=Nocardia sp. CY41 TaxID=2608686 RepID=UPI001915B242|nr:hypothetical protein [Nocardia sp. CY41]
MSISARPILVRPSGSPGSRRAEWGVPGAPVAALPITTVVPDAVVDGPVAELADPIKALHRARFPQLR